MTVKPVQAMTTVVGQTVVNRMSAQEFIEGVAAANGRQFSDVSPSNMKALAAIHEGRHAGRDVFMPSIMIKEPPKKVKGVVTKALDATKNTTKKAANAVGNFFKKADGSLAKGKVAGAVGAAVAVIGGTVAAILASKNKEVEPEAVYT